MVFRKHGDPQREKDHLHFTKRIQSAMKPLTFDFINFTTITVGVVFAIVVGGCSCCSASNSCRRPAIRISHLYRTIPNDSLKPPT